jgi:hypothetical protein
MKKITNDADIVASLRRLAKDTTVPPVDPRRERELLEAFDAAVAARTVRTRRASTPWIAAALSLTAAAAVITMLTVESRRTPAVEPIGATEFVVWPGAGELPAFESGHLVRTRLPASVVLSVGLVPPPSADGVADADVLIGQDGYPRAVRLIP